MIEDNIIEESGGSGIRLYRAVSSVIAKNTVKNSNGCGIYVYHSSNNELYLNNFIGNSDTVCSYTSANFWNSTSKITYTYKGSAYINYLGNYWDDYTDVDADGDGIWDNPYPIDSDRDYHPLVVPLGNYSIEEEWSFAILTDLHIGWGYPDYGGEGYGKKTDGDRLNLDKAQNYWLTERLNRAVNKINERREDYNIEFVMVLGDLNDKGQYSEFWKAKQILDNLTIPYFPIIGNHEVWPYTMQQGHAAGGFGSQLNHWDLGVRFPEKEASYPYGNENFTEVFTDTFFDCQAKKLGIELYKDDASWDEDGEGPKPYLNYNFTYHGINFVCLDSVSRDSADWRDIDFAGAEAGAKISDTTLSWLEKCLSGTNETIIFSHHPMVQTKLGTSAFNQADLSRIDEIIEDSNGHVVANFAGHIHREDIAHNPPYESDGRLDVDDVVTTRAIVKDTDEIIRVVQMSGENINYDRKFGVEDPGINPYFTFSPEEPPLYVSTIFGAHPIRGDHYWIFKNSCGTEVEKEGTVAFHTFIDPGDYFVTLKVKTEKGIAEIKDVRVNVTGAALPPIIIIIAVEDIKVVSLGSGVDLTENPQNTPEWVLLTKTASEEKPIAIFLVHFENATEDIDLSNLTADVNLTARKSLIYMPSWPDEIEESKILYIPSTGKGAVYICRNATSMEEVSWENADVVMNVGETIEGMTVVATLYNDTEYYVVLGVTGTGGGEAPTQHPISSFTYSPENPVVNQTITFNASSSYDPDGNITNYEWHFGDGNVTSTTENTLAHAYSTAGNYTVNLTVTDNDGATNTRAAKITVSNLPDLAINDVWICWPDNCTICYTVTNRGNGAASAGHNTSLFVDGIEQAYDHVAAALAPDASFTGCFNYNWTYTLPNDNVTVCADCNTTVEESNETNNCLSTVWTCGDVNYDKAVDMSDVIDLLYFVGYPGNYTICNQWAADVNGDNLLNMSDVSALLYYAGYPGQYELKCCCM